jgi:RNA polymerase sigma-70 factor (ECF subfamily)
MEDEPEPRRARRGFSTTQWSLIVAAADTSREGGGRALADLCQRYWQPVYLYLRRRGTDRERAADLTQGFFTKLIEKNYAGDAQRERGRFRTFLLTSVQHYAANEWHRDHTIKRGGGQFPVSIDSLVGEETLRLEPSHEETPERLFDRRWAQTLVETCLGRLREERTRSGDVERLDLLLPLLTGDDESGYREVAKALEMTEGAARVYAHRIRRQFREILRDEVARTVSDPTRIEDELRHLFRVLGPGE